MFASEGQSLKGFKVLNEGIVMDSVVVGIDGSLCMEATYGRVVENSESCVEIGIGDSRRL